MTRATGPPHDECYLCGAPGLQPLLEVERHQVWRCTQCGLGETHTAGAAQTPAALYDRSYLEKQWSGAAPSAVQVKRAVRAELERARRVQRSVGLGARRALPLLLDIGCGHGYFLAAARERGFDVRGMDVSPAAAEFCDSHFGIPVEMVAVEEAQLAEGSLDVVTAWHVLEHLADPLALLRKVRLWLAPQGIIAVEVPDHESYDARVRGSDWQGWQPRYHRWHFTPRALALALERAGFALTDTWHSPSRIARERLRRIPVVGLFRRVLWRYYSGTGVAAIGRRPSGCDPPPSRPAAR